MLSSLLIEVGLYGWGNYPCLNNSRAKLLGGLPETQKGICVSFDMEDISGMIKNVMYTLVRDILSAFKTCKG